MSALRNLRKARKLSQLQLADEVGTQEPQISRWETGARRIPLRWAIILARYFSVSIAVLLPEVDIGPESSIDELLRDKADDVRAKAYRAVLEVVLKSS